MVSYISALVAAALALCGMGFYVLCLWSVRTFLRESLLQIRERLGS